MPDLDALDFVTDSEDAGGTLAAALRRRAPSVAWSEVRSRVSSGRVTVEGAVAHDPAVRVKAGLRVRFDPRSKRSEDASGPKGRDDGTWLDDARVLFWDQHLVLVDKPAGMNSVPFEAGERGALSDRVRSWLRRRANGGPNPSLFVVHRIDRHTSGVLCFARTWLAQRHLAGLFRAHAIERAYLALVEGHLTGPRGAPRVTYDTVLIEDRGDGRRGSARKVHAGTGQRAITHVTARAHLKGPASIVECRLETGRTHQIRIHLAEAGHPIAGDDVYARPDAPGRIRAPRTMLHAGLLAFPHPVEREGDVRVSAPPPEDFNTLARSLGARDEDLALG